MKEFKAVECPKCKENFIVRFPPVFEVASEHKCAKHFWEGFDTCLEMVLNNIDNQDSNELPTIYSLRDDIVEEAELYKKDG